MKNKSPERIYTAADNNGHNIFVFGSNTIGLHGAGAAREAMLHWGAKNGHGEGRQGMSYGIPTKDHNIQTLNFGSIDQSVARFIVYATFHCEYNFLVTKIGCGLAGLSEKDIAPMFADAPQNCILPEGWRNEI